MVMVAKSKKKKKKKQTANGTADGKCIFS